MSSVEATQSIEDTLEGTVEDPTLVNTQGEALTENNVESQDPETTKQRTTFKPIDATETFLHRVEQQQRTAEACNNTKNTVKKQHPFVDKVRRNVEFKYKGDHTESGKIPYYIKSLVNPKKHGARIFKGTMRVHLQPLGFTEDDTGKIISYTKLGIKEYGYDDTIERVIDDILEHLFDKKSSIQSIYIGETRKLTKSKDAVNIKAIKKELIKAYKEGKLYITYDNKYSRGTTTGKVLSRTTHYFTLKLRAEFNKQLYMAINKQKAVGWNDKLYTPDNTGVQKYIEDIYKNKNEAAIEFIQDLYKESIKSVEYTFSYDRGVSGGTYIRGWENTLRRYELSTFEGSQHTTAVVASDAIVKILMDDLEFREALDELANLQDYTKNGTSPKSALAKQILRIHEHVSESPLGYKKIDVNEYVNIEYTHPKNTEDDDEYYFIKPNGDKVSLLTLVLDYKMNTKTLEALIRSIHSKTNDNNILTLQAGIRARFDKYVEINTRLYGKNVQSISKEDYVEMVQHLEKDKTRREIERAYDIITTHWKEYEVASQFRLHKTLQHKARYSEYITENVYDIYKQSMKDYIKGQHKDTIETPELYFLINIINSADITRERKLILLNEIFFYDFKTAKNLGSKENIKRIQDEIVSYDIYIKNLDKQIDEVQRGLTTKLSITDLESAKKSALTHKATLEWQEEYFRELNTKFKNDKDKDVFINQVLNNKVPLKELKRVFYSTLDISDTSKYLPAFTDEGDVIVVKKQYATALVEGAGPLNMQIIGRFRYNFDNNIPFNKVKIDNVEYDAWTSGVPGSNYNILIKIPDDTNTYTNQKIAEIRTAAEQVYKNVYILKETALKEISKMLQDEKIVTYNKYKAYKDAEHEQYAGQIDTQLNVKGSKVRVPALMHDLELIDNYLKVGNYERLMNYIGVEDYIKYYKSYGVDNRLLVSNTYNKFANAAHTTLAFFEFADAFRVGDEIPFNLNALAEYFTNEAIKHKQYSTETSVWRELEQKDINGRKGTEVLEEVINVLHEKYKSTDIDLDHSKVLHSDELLAVLDNLYALAVSYTKQDSNYLKTAKRLIAIDRRYTNPEIENIQDTQLKETYNIHNTIYKKFKDFTKSVIEDNKTGTGTHSAIYRFTKLNEHLIAQEFNTLAERHKIQLSNYKHSNVNLKTIHHVIPVFETLMKKVNNNELITAQEFSIIQSLWNSVQQDVSKDLLSLVLQSVKTTKKFKDDNQVYTYVFKEILYPLIQNITLDFYRGSDFTLAYNLMAEQPQLSDPELNPLSPTELEPLNAIATKLVNTIIAANDYDYDKVYKAIQDAIKDTKDYIKTTMRNKDAYGIKLDKYTESILEDIEGFLYGQMLHDLQNAKQLNAPMVLNPMYLIDASGDIMYASYVNFIIQDALLSAQDILDVVEKEYNYIANAKTRNYKIKPEVHFKKYKYKDGVGLKREIILLFDNKKPRDLQQAQTFAEFMEQDLGINKQDAETFIAKIANSLTKQQNFKEDENNIAQPIKTFINASTFFELDNKVMDDHEQYINSLIAEIKSKNPTMSDEKVQEHIQNLYLGLLHYIQNFKRNMHRALSGNQEAYKYINVTLQDLYKQGMNLGFTINEMRNIHNTISKHWGINESYVNTYYEIIFSLKTKKDQNTLSKLPDSKWDIISTINTNVLLFDQDFFDFFKLAFKKHEQSAYLDNLKGVDPELIKKLKIVYANINYLKLPSDILTLAKTHEI
jgi:hypothetical protein